MNHAAPRFSKCSIDEARSRVLWKRDLIKNLPALKEEDAGVILCHCEGQVVGFAVYSNNGLDITLQWVEVHPHEKRHGLGRLLVSEVLAEFPKSDAYAMTVASAGEALLRELGFSQERPASWWVRKAQHS